MTTLLNFGFSRIGRSARGWRGAHAVNAALLSTLVAAASCSGDETAPTQVRGLGFGGIPTVVSAGQSFTVTVELRGAQGEVITGATNRVALELSQGAFAFSGPTTVQAIDGVATFANLTVMQAASSLNFTATSGALSTTSTGFVVVAADPSTERSTVTPSAGYIPPDYETQLTVLIADAFGNPVRAREISMSSTMPGATFTPASGLTSDAGTFVTTFRPNGTGATSVTASASGVAVVNGSFSVVDRCPPVALPVPGTARGVLPCGDYVPGALAPAEYEFASTGGVVALTVASDFLSLLEVSAGVGSNDLVLTSTGSPATVEWLLPTGSHTLRIRSATGLGAFQVSGAVVAATGATVRVLGAMGTYVGQSLAAGDFVNADSKLVDRFIFRASSPCTVTMRTTEFAAKLAVIDFITGARLGEANVDIGVDAVVQLAACRGAGTNPIGIYASRTAGAGAYTLIVEAPPASRSNIVPRSDAGAPISIRSLLGTEHGGRR